MNICNNNRRYFRHPGGMHRSIENGILIQNMHPLGDASLQDAIAAWYLPFLPSGTFLTECESAINVI